MMPETVYEEQLLHLDDLANGRDYVMGGIGDQPLMLDEHQRKALSNLLADHAAGKKREKSLRRLLFLQHPCAGKYGDDGEMQCSECQVDFLRDDPGAIESQLARVTRAALAKTPDDPGLATKEGKPK